MHGWKRLPIYRINLTDGENGTFIRSMSWMLCHGYTQKNMLFMNREINWRNWSCTTPWIAPAAARPRFGIVSRSCQANMRQQTEQLMQQIIYRSEEVKVLTGNYIYWPMKYFTCWLEHWQMRPWHVVPSIYTWSNWKGITGPSPQLKYNVGGNEPWFLFHN